MIDRTEVEKTLAETRRRRDEAEAEAGHAARELVRLAGGSVPLLELDTDSVRAAADTYADAAQRLKLLEEAARQLRSLLM